MLSQWEKAKDRQLNEGVVATVTSANPACLQKPGLDSLKCNVDAAIFEDDNKYGVGICVRDDRGIFKSGKTMWF